MTDEKPHEVRAAIEAAIESLNRTRGFIPENVGFPIMMAHRKLNVALIEIYAWEAQIRYEQACKEME